MFGSILYINITLRSKRPRPFLKCTGILRFNILPKPSKIARPLTLALSTVGERVRVRKSLNDVGINLSDDRKN